MIAVILLSCGASGDERLQGLFATVLTGVNIRGGSADSTGHGGVVVEDDVKVLLIEDDVAAAEMYRLRLVADGYSVVMASDGNQGLRMAADEAPDFIYLDLRLPGLDGFEVLERLRAGETTMHIPVIILTNYGEPELRERGLKLGALEFLVKADTTPAELSESVERATGPRALPST